MNLFAFFALLAFLSYLALGVFVYMLDSKRLLNRIFFIYSLAAAAYSFSEFGYLQAESYETAWIWIKARSIWPFTFAFALHFHCLFTRKTNWVEKPYQLGILYFPAFLVFFVDLFTTWITGTPVLRPDSGIWGYQPPLDSILPLLAGFFALFYTLAMLGLVLHSVWSNRSRKSFTHTQVYYILAADILVILIVLVNTFLQNIPNFVYINVDSALLLFSNIIIVFSIWKFSSLRVTKDLAHDEIVSSMSEFLILVNPDGRISAVNNLTVEITGFTEDELENKYIHNFFDHEYQTEGFGWIHPEKEERQKKKGALITHTGSSVPISYTVISIPLQGGKELGWAYMGKVLTESEPQPIQTGTQNRIANKDSVNQLIKVINHDLSEGTRLIHLCTQLVEYDKLEQRLADELLFFAEDKTQQLILDNLERNRNHLVYIKEEALLLRKKLRALGEYAAADYEQKRTAVDLNKVAELAFSQIVRYPEKMNVEISIGELPTIEAVPEQIFRLLKHLMANALKFRKLNESLHIHIEVIFHDLKKAVIEFRDNGIGISPEYHQGVFEIFQRLHHPTQYEGVGIGLAICKKIVDAHKGEIWIKPEHKTGTAICIELPA